jgi:transcription elongation factor GreA
MAFITKKQPVIPPIPLTQSELDKKKKELKKLLITQEEVIKRLATAREMGDLSENGAYHAAKHELGNTRRQLRSVKHILKYSYVPKISNSKTIKFGSKVVLEKNNKKLKFTLVSQYESNPLEGKLSMESPIGKTIMGKKMGDKVTVNTPNGKVNYIVLEIK